MSVTGYIGQYLSYFRELKSKGIIFPVTTQLNMMLSSLEAEYEKVAIEIIGQNITEKEIKRKMLAIESHLKQKEVITIDYISKPSLPTGQQNEQQKNENSLNKYNKPKHNNFNHKPKH